MLSKKNLRNNFSVAVRNNHVFAEPFIISLPRRMACSNPRWFFTNPSKSKEHIWAPRWSCSINGVPMSVSWKKCPPSWVNKQRQTDFGNETKTLIIPHHDQDLHTHIVIQIPLLTCTKDFQRRGRYLMYGGRMSKGWFEAGLTTPMHKVSEQVNHKLFSPRVWSTNKNVKRSVETYVISQERNKKGCEDHFLRSW